MTNWKGLVQELEKNIKADIDKSRTLKDLWYVTEANAQKGRFNGTTFFIDGHTLVTAKHIVLNHRDTI